MGRTFTLEIKQGGKWQRVTAVFPFISGELLDERLDEGSITFFDRTKAHKPLTEFRISFYKGAVGVDPDNDIYGNNTEYFILANDNSAEYPVGSGVYKHEAYLIERTKLLEGILCPSITLSFDKDEIQNLTIPKILHMSYAICEFFEGNQMLFALHEVNDENLSHPHIHFVLNTTNVNSNIKTRIDFCNEYALKRYIGALLSDFEITEKLIMGIC